MNSRPTVFTVERGECDQGDHALLGVFFSEEIARLWVEHYSDYREQHVYCIREHTVDEASEFALRLGQCPKCGRDSVSGARGAEYSDGGFRAFIVYRHLDRLGGTVADTECRHYVSDAEFNETSERKPAQPSGA